ncbi:CCR4-NOT transcription complex subunit 3-like isoform X2 [Ctenocephalides felis]|uniref:CCR4-NOT transcription complex subunit 3-like isoform X2 n=1 Tax=Ctenocephalides felis TaxID=7515 RepID=UPI000E6E2B0D|nr:CCR4-NOT transcription complex subunit 3-like isoform X2 [Ctenocephalides felis]XP_026480534.1 CCR4-NOT transcription complex subunit 3-like isoform X2 [Ctenocephalides felis]
MAATRKLQGEIDRCLKKVTEGVETFEDIWQKVYNATNSNQKEKYEADLKKEIKKLQRLRDQIKSWIASGEIKDKSTLLDYRKLIETQMERFKVVERETKTKAYSKEGLGAAQKLDPAQKERDDISSWLANKIDALNIQIDQFESEIESLLAGKKKRVDKDKQDRIDDLRSRLEKHRYHIKKLETLLRMLDNMSVEVDQNRVFFYPCSEFRDYTQFTHSIKRIKDDVEYYIDANQEPDFEENEYIYDDIIGLDEIELSGVGLPSSATTDSNNSNDTAGSPISMASGTSPIASPSMIGCINHNHSSDCHENDCHEKRKREDVPILSKITPVKPTAVRANSNLSTSASSTILNTSAGSNANNSVTVNSNSTSNNISVNNKITPSALASSTPSKPPPPPSPHTNNSIGSTNNGGNFAAVIKHSTTHLENGPIIPLRAPSPILATSTAGQTLSVVAVSTTPAIIPTAPTVTSQDSSVHNSCETPDVTNTNITEINKCSPVIMNGPSISEPTDSMSSLKSIAQEVVNRVGLEMTSVMSQQQQQSQLSASQQQLSSSQQQTQQIPPTLIPTSVQSSDTRPQSLFEQPPPPSSNVPNANSMVTLNEAHIPPLLGVAPLGPVPLQKEHQCQFQMMEAAFYHMPHPSDSERLRQYLPRNPAQTPSYYPQTPLPHSDTVEFFQRLSTESLFFIFYYMEGTKAQYLAAKALKKQSWRFHTKYMMWFQRHEEPKIINEEYEQGTYIYFDYEKWGQRKKEGFTFEYKYLEDRDLN